jgi:cytochrome c-type biogenesis protein CcmH
MRALQRLGSWLVLMLALGFASLAWAAQAPQAPQAIDLAEDPAVEARLVAIAEELRCLVCQNESLASSRADLAQDLRREVRNLIKQGKSDQEVMDFLVSRYGDFVRYRPPVKPTTWLLWGGPFIFGLAGVLGLLVFLHRRVRQVPRPLSAADHQRARDLLSAKESPGEH